METQEEDVIKNIVVVGELPFFYDPNDKAVQDMLKRSQKVGAGVDTYEIKLPEGGKKKKKPGSK